MEAKASFIDPLFEKTEQYCKSSFELLKLKSLDKTADVASTLVSRFLLTIAISIFALTLNIGIALWLGDLLGKSYYGFLVVALFYAIIGIVLLIIHSKIKASVSNAIVSQMLK